ncbi:MAG: GNAT family N-acetyltransferase [Planctomycetes bacterium]|nr:GNAT family N-acetyltransferase [Planctomycetota bacterium]MBI3843655.1 GNAT family N-acetyltransferase [Planctomycetota bacterium]
MSLIEVRLPRLADSAPCIELAAALLGATRARAFVKQHFERHQIVVAEAEKNVVGLLAFRTDWFDCTLVRLVVVHEEWRRRGIAREMFAGMAALSPSPRIFSSAPETDAAAIQLHSALGFHPSGYVDNLPHGPRELFFYKRIPPRALRVKQ